MAVINALILFLITALNNENIYLDACSCSNTVRLVNGPSPNEGHIELFHQGEWKSFCDDEIYYDSTGLQGGKTSSVVCRMLGYTMGYESYRHTSPYGRSTETTWLDNMRCDGTESNLEECQFLGECKDLHNIGVTCKGEIDCCDIPKVLPEIRHTMQGDIERILSPYLQFRCDRRSNDTNPYLVNWYVDNVQITQKGPSNISDDLVLTEHELTKEGLGFDVECGVLKVNASTNVNDSLAESNETKSLPFYAGLKISEQDITVSKGGYTTVQVTQTVPLGCQYNENDSSGCSTTLSLYDENLSENPCDAGINAVNAADDDICVNEIVAQKQTDVWDSDIVYTFRVSTVDNNYDDAKEFDLRLELGNNVRHTLWQSYVVDNFHVNVEETGDYKDKMCYSHVDPHMRTCDGNYYENQKEGFYMLFHHIEADVEVQEATRYCFGGNSGPVCACGIAVRAGKDVFMINRCGSINLLDFLRCDDGGIIQVERINDYRYKIVTPTGTQIFANLLGGSYQNTMNIDIILSAKDIGKTEGLCGLCDGNPSNDFIRKDGITSSNNADYTFSNSWRLTDDINLFTASKRILESWAVRNEVTCRCVEGICTVQRRRECGRTVNSITKTKCDIQSRKKRALGDYKHQKEIDRLYALMLTPRRIITKRSTVETNVTAGMANTACNESIYSAPAVVEFPNKTAGEDLGELVKQCVYDVEESNDTSWATVHVDAINTITKNILDLNPEYVANKTDEVEIFLTQTCSKNCSGNGICLDTGECNCTSLFRGPDCSLDIRDPIIIEDVEGGGECDKANSSECTCFTIRAVHLFEGFSCRTTITRIQNSSEQIVLTENVIEKGAYEDIYTGTCCITEEQNALSAENDFVHLYKFSASNDGNSFGDSQNVYVYDSTCHNIYINETVTDISLKGSFCFIDNQCYVDGELSYTGCQFCKPSVTAYNWTEYNQCVNGGTCIFQDSEYMCECMDGYDGINCEKDIDECVSIPCQNYGTCVDAVNGYTCNCSDGYEGKNCETDIDDCVSDPCGVGGVCIDHVNAFSCNCSDGYTGTHCETNIDECVSQPCRNGGTCVDQINGYNCTCVNGYEGVTCINETNECLSNPCQNGGTCSDEINRYNCTCARGFEGSNCETDTNECQSNPCQNGANCTDEVNGYTCTCSDGYEGANCEKDIDECQSNPCQNGANCTNEVNGYECICVAGYEGNNCETEIDECLSNPCQNGATCTNEVNRYKCTCAGGYEGSNCMKDIDECASQPCWNGGTCVDQINGFNCTCVTGYEGITCLNETDECVSDPCQHGTCADNFNGYTCTCLAGYGGKNCELDEDECESEPCKHGSTCKDQINAYVCICAEGYNGTDCEMEVDECLSNPCQNGATCIDEVNRYTCTCAGGYEGSNCETETNECQSSPCQNGANCTDEVNGYTCTCTAGFEGTNCEEDTDECQSNPCLNGADCTDEINGYKCICEEGYEGTSCETEINECQSNPCQNGGTCNDEINRYNCTCAGGFEGSNCETDTNECQSSPCENGANCTDEVNGYTCTCSDGYEGANCEKDIDECQSSPCQNGANCTDKVSEYECICAAGYEGNNCETEIDECLSNPCLNGASCLDEVNRYKCHCAGGYEGSNCETETDECQSSPCQNGANCTDEVNGYTCTCSEGYEGANCETDIDECQSNPCYNGASCNDEVNGYQCICVDGYDGSNCKLEVNECLSSPCQNGANCTDEVNGYSCTCAEGYKGTNCETEIDECLSNPCQNGATCMDKVNRYNCTCAKGYEGSSCETEINECLSNPCQNEGTCKDEVNRYNCTCAGGYEGSNCETEINECLSNPCQNGGTCKDEVNRYNCTCAGGYEGSNCETEINECLSNPCQNGGTCKDEVNRYNCTCAGGYEGSNCETEINECMSNPCQNGGDCKNEENRYNCTCAGGYEGTNCETEINECLSNPCQNGGTCKNEENRYNCTCGGGYEGSNCETEINECLSNPCQNGGTCKDEVNRYNCTCAGGFEGSNCETEIDECLSNPCQNGATCTNEVNEYKCTCAEGYEGSSCETETNECQSSPCQNGATCTDEENRYSCTCAGGYEGSNCETDIDECQSSPCENGANCTDEVNGYKCICADGYEGNNCEIETDECLSNPCQNDASCSDVINGYICTCPGGYEGSNCETAITTTTSQTHTVSIKHLPMRIVFPIDAIDIDLSDPKLKQEIKQQIVAFYINLVGETFKRVSNVTISNGSLVVDFVAEYEDSEQTSSNFTNANVDLVSGDKTMELLNRSVSATSITIDQMTVTAESVKSDNVICEVFLTINGACLDNQHCSMTSRTARCVENDQKFGLIFVVVMIVCAFAAFILLAFIICFSVRGYRRMHQTQKHNADEYGSRNSGSESVWPYRTSIPAYSKTWGIQNKNFGYLSYPGEIYSESQRRTYSKQKSNSRESSFRLGRHDMVCRTDSYRQADD